VDFLSYGEPCGRAIAGIENGEAEAQGWFGDDGCEVAEGTEKPGQTGCGNAEFCSAPAKALPVGFRAEDAAVINAQRLEGAQTVHGCGRGCRESGLVCRDEPAIPPDWP
jgi:hypothetical protein